VGDVAYIAYVIFFDQCQLMSKLCAFHIVRKARTHATIRSVPLDLNPTVHVLNLGNWIQNINLEHRPSDLDPTMSVS